MMASMTGGNRKAELAPTNMVAVMATPRRATNQAPTVLCTESWPAIMAPMLAKTPKQAKYAAGDVTTNTMHRLAASMTTAPMVMVKRAPMRAMRAPMTGAESPWKSTNREKPMPSNVPLSPREASCSMRGLTTFAAGRMTPDEQKYMSPNTPINT